MAGRRINPNHAKINQSYTIGELAARLHVHKNTVRDWHRKGLEPIDDSRPILFQGAVVRAFLVVRNARRKAPCPPGTMYCFKCRQPRAPALGMVEYRELTPVSGNLGALCSWCE